MAEKGDTKTVREIVCDYLTANGYDGLYSPGECGCLIADLMPCCLDGGEDCKAGYRQESSDPDYDFFVGGEKPTT